MEMEWPSNPLFTFKWFIKKAFLMAWIRPFALQAMQRAAIETPLIVLPKSCAKMVKPLFITLLNRSFFLNRFVGCISLCFSYTHLLSAKDFCVSK